MNSVRCRKIFKIALCFLIIAAMSIMGFKDVKFTTDARAESISSMKDQISQYESQKSGLESKINALEDDIDDQQEYLDTLNSYISTVESKIMTCENLLATYQSQIDEMNSEIDAKEEELEENKELFKRRIRSIYMSGSNNTLNLLLGADYFADYLSMEQFTESLAKYDNALMIKINNTMDEINKKIKKKNKAMDEQESVKKELAEERANLQEKHSEATQVYNSINKSKQSLEDELKQLDANIAALEQKISAAYEAARQAALNDNIKYDGNGFAWPLPGYRTITSQFGMRFDPYYQCYRGHNGIDISGGGVAGKPIVASANGQVIATMPTSASGGYGEYVIISHGYIDGSLVTTHYAHMMNYTVSVGQNVNQGDVIGYVGTTGASTGYHLHFEVRVNNSPVNPFNYVS